MLYKRYVDVVTYITKKGEITPVCLIWDNKQYPIDKVIQTRKAASVVGGCGILYKCKIGGHMRNLFWEDDKRWFLESFQP